MGSGPVSVEQKEEEKRERMTGHFDYITRVFPVFR